MRALFFQQRALAFHSPAITGQCPVVAHDAMARNRYGQRVRGTRSGDGPYRFRRADTFRDLGVARGLARRDFAQRLPYELLKRSAPYVEREIQAYARRFDKADYLGDESFEFAIVADQSGAREAVLQITRELVGIITHQYGANTTLALCHQDGA